MKKTVFSVIILALTIISCAKSTGSLEILLNGEAFVQDGFTSNDGWAIDFEHVYVNISTAAVYQTDPPFEPDSGKMPDGISFNIDKAETVDLKSPYALMLTDVPTGQYNALSWTMDGDAVQMIGTAVKDAQAIAFDIIVDDSYEYRCGEYLGDERKGFVTADETANVEMTFHFDHIFGDADAPDDEAINVKAFGFSPFAQLAVNDALQIRTSELQERLSTDDYNRLMQTIRSLGHVGEGHCYEAVHQ